MKTWEQRLNNFVETEKKTRDLMYSGPNMAGRNNNASGPGQSKTEKNKSRQQRKKEKKKAASSETIS